MDNLIWIASIILLVSIHLDNCHGQPQYLIVKENRSYVLRQYDKFLNAKPRLLIRIEPKFNQMLDDVTSNYKVMKLRENGDNAEVSPEEDNSIPQEFDVRSKKGSFSVDDSLNILRERVLLEMARKKALQDEQQIEENRRFLQKIGKRTTSYYSLSRRDAPDEEIIIDNPE